MYSITELNTNPIFTPPDFLLNGIAEHPTATLIKNIDMEKEFLRARELTFKIRKCGYGIPNLFGTSSTRTRFFPYKKPTAGKGYKNVIEEKGIEILGMKPSINMKIFQ